MASHGAHKVGSPEMVQEMHSKGQSLQLLEARGMDPGSQDQDGDHGPSFTGGLRLAVSLLGWPEAESVTPQHLCPVRMPVFWKKCLTPVIQPQRAQELLV